MKHKNWITALAFLALLAGCVGNQPGVSSGPSASVQGGAEISSQPSGSEEPSGDNSVFREAENDWLKDQFQQAGYHPAPEYEMIGVGYFVDEEQNVRDAYLPYGGEIALGPNLVMAANHGAAVSITFQKFDSASAALETYVGPFEDALRADGTCKNIRVGEIHTEDNDTIGFCAIAYEIEYNGNHEVKMLFYADVRQDGYLLAKFEFVPDGFDDQTEMLVRELEDCYALKIPGFDASTDWLAEIALNL